MDSAAPSTFGSEIEPVVFRVQDRTSVDWNDGLCVARALSD